MIQYVKSFDHRIQLAYRTYGSGDECILAFHGFGHPKEDWAFIESEIPTHQRLIAVDVIGHGESYFPEDRLKNQPLQKEEWKELIEAILIQEKIDRFHLAGYSLGGRISMVTAELFPERIISMLLFSPDGLHKSVFFRFANEWSVGRVIFRWLLTQVPLVVKLIKLIGKTRLVPATKIKFLLYQIENKDRLDKVKIVWGALSKLWPDFNRVFVKNTISRKNTIAFGKHDPIILPAFGKAVRNYPVKIEILPLGHRTLKKEGIDLLKKLNHWPMTE